MRHIPCRRFDLVGRGRRIRASRGGCALAYTGEQLAAASTASRSDSVGGRFTASSPTGLAAHSPVVQGRRCRLRAAAPSRLDVSRRAGRSSRPAWTRRARFSRAGQQPALARSRARAASRRAPSAYSTSRRTKGRYAGWSGKSPARASSGMPTHDHVAHPFASLDARPASRRRTGRRPRRRPPARGARSGGSAARRARRASRGTARAADDRAARHRANRRGPSERSALPFDARRHQGGRRHRRGISTSRRRRRRRRHAATTAPARRRHAPVGGGASQSSTSDAFSSTLRVDPARAARDRCAPAARGPTASARSMYSVSSRVASSGATSSTRTASSDVNAKRAVSSAASESVSIVTSPRTRPAGNGTGSNATGVVALRRHRRRSRVPLARPLSRQHHASCDARRRQLARDRRAPARRASSLAALDEASYSTTATLAFARRRRRARLSCARAALSGRSRPATPDTPLR